MHKNYVTYVPMCKKRKSRFYLFHVPNQHIVKNLLEMSPRRGRIRYMPTAIDRRPTAALYLLYFGRKSVIEWMIDDTNTGCIADVEGLNV